MYGCAVAAAQETRPAPVPMDQSTPRGALKTLASAMDAGDAAVIRRILHAENPTEQKMVAAIASFAEAIGKLRKSAIAEFGAESARPLTGDPGEVQRALDVVDGAHETITGDTAIVAAQEAEQQPITLQKVNNQWVVPMKEWAGDIDPTTLEDRLRNLSIQTRLLSESAAEIGDHKYKSADEAKQNIDARLRKAALEQASPSTRPATAPTTQP